MKEKKITQDDVAKKAGVTRSMVSYVLNGSDRSVAQETKEKILQAIEELGYRPNKFAQSLSSGNDLIAGNRIGVVLTSADMFLRPYYAEMIAGIHSAAHENKYHVSFIRFFEELKNPILFNELIHSEEICGLILLSTDICLHTENDRQIIEKIKERIEKIVCVEWQYEGLSSVNFDRKEAEVKAVNYLFEKGHTEIAYIGEQDERVLGFKEAHVLKGFQNIEKLYIDSANDMESGYKAASNILKLFIQGKLKNLPNAISCGSDEVAIGVMRCLNQNHIAVPEKVAVISIDNIEMSEYTNPPLTTINVQKRLMGARAVEMIVNETAKQNENAMTINLPLMIIERKSA